MSKIDSKKRENEELQKRNRTKLCQDILRSLLSLIQVHACLRQTPFSIIDRSIFASMLKLMLEMVSQDPGAKQLFFEKELLKEILRVKVSLDKRQKPQQQKNLDEQTRSPTAFKEGHDLIKKLITILIEDPMFICQCIEMEILYFFNSKKCREAP